MPASRSSAAVLVPPTATGGTPAARNVRSRRPSGPYRRTPSSPDTSRSPWQSRTPAEGVAPATNSPEAPNVASSVPLGLSLAALAMPPVRASPCPDARRSHRVPVTLTTGARPCSGPSTARPPLPNDPSSAPAVVTRTTAAATSPGKATVVARQMPSTMRPLRSIAMACVLANVTPAIGSSQEPAGGEGRVGPAVVGDPRHDRDPAEARAERRGAVHRAREDDRRARDRDRLPAARKPAVGALRDQQAGACERRIRRAVSEQSRDRGHVVVDLARDDDAALRVERDRLRTRGDVGRRRRNRRDAAAAERRVERAVGQQAEHCGAGAQQRAVVERRADQDASLRIHGDARAGGEPRRRERRRAARAERANGPAVGRRADRAEHQQHQAERQHATHPSSVHSGA